MIYAFRFIGKSGRKYYGMACAKNKKHLYWLIDRHGDPNSCEIKSLSQGSICFFAKKDNYDDIEITNIELSETMENVVFEDKGFKKPTWPPFEELAKL